MQKKILYEFLWEFIDGILLEPLQKSYKYLWRNTLRNSGRYFFMMFQTQEKFPKPSLDETLEEYME